MMTMTQTEHDYVPGAQPFDTSNPVTLAMRQWRSPSRSHGYIGAPDDVCEICGLPQLNRFHSGTLRLDEPVLSGAPVIIDGPTPQEDRVPIRTDLVMPAEGTAEAYVITTLVESKLRGLTDYEIAWQDLVHTTDAIAAARRDLCVQGWVVPLYRDGSRVIRRQLGLAPDQQVWTLSDAGWSAWGRSH